MVDLRDLQTPLIALVSAVAGALVGHQKFKRQASKDELAHAEHGGGIRYIRLLNEERDAAVAKLEVMTGRLMEATDKIHAMRMHELLLEEKVDRFGEQLSMVTDLLLEVRPDWEPKLKRWGFVNSEPGALPP